MNKVTVTKGLDIPLAGAPERQVVAGPGVQSVGLLGDDYVGMKPTMLVGEGDRVKLGQAVFEDKKTPGVQYTAPASGTVASINRGAKRRFQSLVIDVDGEDAETFESYPDVNFHSLDRDKIVANLTQSGLWPAFRTRPYGKVPTVDSTPNSIFVTAMDSNPLAVDPQLAFQEADYERYFTHGLQLLTVLTGKNVFLCKAAGADIPGDGVDGVQVAEFSGPHPSGLVGTHIHFLDPVNENKTVWHIDYQDVVAIGHLFITGQLLNTRIVSVAGPAIAEPKIVRTQLGVDLHALTKGGLTNELARVISGSVLSGRQSQEPMAFLGRYHSQVVGVEEGTQREFMGWAMPGFDKFSVTRAFASAFGQVSGGLKMTTSTQGSVRAIVPIGNYEKVMPLDIVATPLLKSLVVQDTDTAMMLGCLELDEEDLGLCTFVCPGKNDYGPLLRDCLTHIEREG